MRKDSRPWTAASVIARLAVDLETIPLWFETDLWVLALARFGRESLSYSALVARATGRREDGPTVVDICRERYLWRRSRRSLYRWSKRAALDLAQVLNDSATQAAPRPVEPAYG